MLKGHFMNKVAQFLSVLVAGLMFFGAVVSAEPDDEWPKNFSCTFDAGTRGSYEAGKFTSATASPLSFEITDVDLEDQNAHLRTSGSDASGTLRIVRAINANHFLEVVPEGFLNLTTVYDDKNHDGAHPAVHSRHLGVLGQPLFSQYTGICRAKD